MGREDCSTAGLEQVSEFEVKRLLAQGKEAVEVPFTAMPGFE